MNQGGYLAGDLKLKFCPYPTRDECWGAWEKRGGREKGEPLCLMHIESVPDGEAFLPHQCEEWVIGDSENIKQLIYDLENLLDMKELK